MSIEANCNTTGSPPDGTVVAIAAEPPPATATTAAMIATRAVIDDLLMVRPSSSRMIDRQGDPTRPRFVRDDLFIGLHHVDHPGPPARICRGPARHPSQSRTLNSRFRRGSSVR